MMCDIRVAECTGRLQALFRPALVDTVHIAEHGGT
jgi:hypothetical protein